MADPRHEMLSSGESARCQAVDSQKDGARLGCYSRHICAIRVHASGPHQCYCGTAWPWERAIAGSSSPATVFMQWKNTNACTEHHCPCGWYGHFDGFFLYAWRCSSCGKVWVMPTEVVAHEASAAECERLGATIREIPLP